ncbi:MAG: hypothetical protein WAT67_14780 [Candidatus Contendobacter sp.]
MTSVSPVATGQRGMVLVIVLWIITLLAVMAGSFAYSMRIETQLAASAAERARARALADAGIAYALAWQLDPEGQKQWPPNGDTHLWEFGGGRVRIAVTNASGLVNLNNAGPDLLKALLKGAGLEEGEAERVADAIQDWRDPDNDRMPHGAEGPDYQAAGRPGPKNTLFESIEELGQVLGVTPDLYARLAGLVTPFSYESAINPELAPAPILRLLGMDEATLSSYLEARARASAEGTSAPPPTGNEASAGYFFGGRSSVYHIAVTAELASGSAAGLEAVYDVRGGGFIVQSAQSDGLVPSRLLSWREQR